MVSFVEPHADDAEGAASGGANLLFFETNRLPFGGGKNHFLLSVGQAHADHFVAIFQADRANPARARIGVEPSDRFF